MADRTSRQPPPDPPRQRATGRAVLAYNAWRVLLFAACFGVAFVAGLRGLALIVVALIASGLLSWFVLGRQRVAMGEAVEQKVTRARQRMAERTAAEDAYADVMAAQDAARRPRD